MQLSTRITESVLLLKLMRCDSYLLQEFEDNDVKKTSLQFVDVITNKMLKLMRYDSHESAFV